MADGSGGAQWPAAGGARNSRRREWRRQEAGAPALTAGGACDGRSGGGRGDNGSGGGRR